MSEIIVKQLAQIVGTPVEIMLKQLQDAGIDVTSQEDAISDTQKLLLLEHIRKGQQSEVQNPSIVTATKKNDIDKKHKNYKENVKKNSELRVSSLTIENFKGYTKLSYECNINFNIIVGENNIGKSTIFDAFLLWEIAYKKLITQSNTFYKTNSKSNIITISESDLSIFKISDVSNLYNNANRSCTLGLNFKIGEIKQFNLSIEFERVDTHNNYIKININKSYKEFDRFHKHFSENNKISVRDTFSIRQSQPIANITSNEYFLYNAQLKKKSNSGYSFEVLRNKILNTITEKKFEYLETKLSNLLNVKFKLRWKNTNRDNDVNINITIQEEGKQEVDLALVGSGVLNLLEIFSSLYVKKQRTNILLLDEPDSHIHSEIQEKLITELRDTSPKSQIFIISHNDRLIHAAQSGELFYVDKTVKSEMKLTHFPLDYNSLSKIHKEMAGRIRNETLLDDTPVLLVEGKTDQIILKSAWEKLYPKQDMPFKIMPSGIEIEEDNRSGGAEAVRRTLEFISTMSNHIIIGLFDNDREGRERYKGLSNKIFEKYEDNSNTRKHKVKNIYGMCLLVPKNRVDFVAINSVKNRFLTIEHYFSNRILQDNNMIGDYILSSNVFDISGDKAKFSKNCKNLPKSEYNNFILLFEEITRLISGSNK